MAQRDAAWRSVAQRGAERRRAAQSDADAAMVGPFWKVTLNLLRRKLDIRSFGFSRTRLTVRSTMADIPPIDSLGIHSGPLIL